MIILRKNGYKLCIILIFLAIAAWISCEIDNFLISSNQYSQASQNDVLYKILGQLRKDIAAICYLKADQYFHKGTRHQDDHHNCFSKEMDFDQGHEHDHEHKITQTKHHAKNADLFAKIEKAIYYRPVSHLKPAENAEIIPWFDITTRINPDFEQAFLDGSYWLSMRMNKPDEALSFLRRGFKNNPYSWQIAAQMGNIYFISKKDYKKAYYYFKYAFKLIKTSQHTDIDEKQVLVFLSACAKKLNKEKEYLYYESLISNI
jgi:tetratricopeptide (TPR) repeat protein